MAQYAIFGTLGSLELNAVKGVFFSTAISMVIITHNIIYNPKFYLYAYAILFTRCIKLMLNIV